MDIRGNKQYKCLPFLAMLLITLSILTRVLAKPILINPLTVAFFIGPFWFLLNDVIAEVYGNKVAMKLFWCGYGCQILFLGIYYFFISFHSPDISKQNAFHFVIHDTWDEFLFSPLALYIAWRINAHLLTKWKLLMRGRYFWLRSIGSSGLAEILFPIILVPEALIFWDLKYVIHFVFWISIIRLFLITLFAFPFSIVASFIKNIEQINIYSKQDNLDLFQRKSIPM